MASRKAEALLDRALGCLVGLAAGDALGTAVEFSAPGSFEPVTTMRGGGAFRLLPGQWTDDTSMALCIAESIVRKGPSQWADVQERFCRWYEEGHLSSTGECFDIGITTRQGLNEFKRTKNPMSGPTSEQSAGNGCIMRLAPVSIASLDAKFSAVQEMAASSACTTHGAPLAVACTQVFSHMLICAMKGVPKEYLLNTEFPFAVQDTHKEEAMEYWIANPMEEVLTTVMEGSYRDSNPPEIVASGFSVKALEAALWAFHSTASFEEGCLKVVNLGDDADTVGAIYGQLAGAHYGFRSIPTAWTEKVSFLPLMEAFATDLLVTGCPTLQKDIEEVSETTVEERKQLLAVYDALEEAYRHIHRKATPGRRMYKTVEVFKGDTRSFRDSFDAASRMECGRQPPRHLSARLEILYGEFERRFPGIEEAIKKRASRPKLDPSSK